jgi:ribosomal protein S18 acetylase RimI-like enzyme
MTTLMPMRPEVFSSFAAKTVVSYADDNVTAGRWPPEGALARSRTDFEHLLPQGLGTPDHYLYEIRDETLEETTGFIWFAVVGSAISRSGYIYNIQIAPEFRGRGHAKAALELIERVAVARAVSRIDLHVFSFNAGAQALYRSLGYGITGMNMVKSLRPNGA